MTGDTVCRDQIIDKIAAAAIAAAAASSASTRYSKGFISGLTMACAIAADIEGETFEEMTRKGSDIVVAAIERLTK